MKGGAAILAGGASRRMGRDKALIEVDGIPVVDRTAAILHPLANPVIVVGGVGARIGDCPVVPDLYPGVGPLGGIVTALSALGEGAHFVVACDMPFLQTDVLRLLLDLETGEADAAVPRIGGRPEPLCAVYRHACLPRLRDLVEGGERAAHRALHAVRVRYVDEDQLRAVDPELVSFTNINTPEDAERWLRSR